MQGNSLRCEIRNASRSWDLARSWSKWYWNIHYWVASKVCPKSHDERLATDGATARGIPPRTKLESYDEHEILHISGQSDVEIYIIRSTLKYVPSTMTNGWLRTEVQAGEFPQMRNYEHIPKVRSCMFMVKVMLKYTLLGRLWSMCQVPWRTVGYGRRYKQGNSPEDEIKDDPTSPVLVCLWSEWRWNIPYWVTSEVYAKYHDDRTSLYGATSWGISSDAKLETDDEHEF
jgi:hypothetical protein